MQLLVANVQVLAVAHLVREVHRLLNVLQAADTVAPMRVVLVATATATTHVGVEQAVATKSQTINSAIIKNRICWDGVGHQPHTIKKAVSRRYNPLSLLPSGPGEVNGELAVPPLQM